MNILEVSFEYNYHNGARVEIEQITEDRFQKIVKYAKGNPGYYSDLKILRNLGKENCTLIPIWLKIGRNNPWIREAYDPEFNERSFAECKTVDYLIQQFARGNWSVGSAFYYGRLCFINQVDGGDEWVVIRGDIKFESVSCGAIIRSQGENAMKELIERFLVATDEQLKRLDY